VFGSGLVTLSRHSISRHGFWRYAAGGFATNIGCGDYYAGKGAGRGWYQDEYVPCVGALLLPLPEACSSCLAGGSRFVHYSGQHCDMFALVSSWQVCNTVCGIAMTSQLRSALVESGGGEGS
jgi:hypothetical protein